MIHARDVSSIQMAPPSSDDLPDGYFVGSANQVLDEVLARIEQGEHDQAETIIRQLIRQRPGHAETWNLRGVNALKGGSADFAVQCFTEASSLDRESADYAANLGHALGMEERWEQAAGAWSRAVLLAPDDADYQLGLAISLLQQGMTDEALEHGDRALQGDPNPEAIFSFAKVLFERGETKSAINAYTSGLERAPENVDGQFHLGLLLQKIGSLEEAASHYRTLLVDHPTHADALCNLSAAARELGKLDEAIDTSKRALALKPNFAEAHNNLGLALCARREEATAIPHFEAALRESEASYETLNNLGVARQACGDLVGAEQTLREALAFESSSPAAERNLGNVLREADRLDEAVELYRQAIGKSPLDFATYGNLGLVLINLNKPDEAITVYGKALSLQPDLAALRKSLGIAQLMKGDYTAGWQNYEARLEETPCSSSLPRWRPGHDATSVLVSAEQGFGDTLQFCRYLTRLADLGLDVTFECQAPLTRLMTLLDPRLRIETIGNAEHKADAHIPLLSLPLAFETTLESIPADDPYLAADPELIQRWAARITSSRGRVGLVWSGNPGRQDDRMRSCPLPLLKPILESDRFDFYSLQKEGVPQTLDELTDLSPHLDDFAETAAAIANLDLVITVDTAVAHLAGALGKQVWVMLGYSADWRYLLARNDSPWYPTMRLFRQKHPGVWAGAIETAAAELSKWQPVRETRK
ncbi:MAG TPA: hypothetical protein DCS82_12165 [Rhodospirillaceae bacterium]|nr:hypothetical protein [Rhodospirillaceae bacterium]